jgi:hypothetical protein
MHSERDGRAAAALLATPIRRNRYLFIDCFCRRDAGEAFAFASVGEGYNGWGFTIDAEIGGEIGGGFGVDEDVGRFDGFRNTTIGVL